MTRYSVHYVEGPNENLKISRRRIVEAVSFQEALAGVSDWPIVETYDHTSACAQNPGTSLYYVEAWEAFLLAEKPEAAQS